MSGFFFSNKKNIENEESLPTTTSIHVNSKSRKFDVSKQENQTQFHYQC